MLFIIAFEQKNKTKQKQNKTKQNNGKKISSFFDTTSKLIPFLFVVSRGCRVSCVVCLLIINNLLSSSYHPIPRLLPCSPGPPDSGCVCVGLCVCVFSNTLQSSHDFPRHTKEFPTLRDGTRRHRLRSGVARQPTNARRRRRRRGGGGGGGGGGRRRRRRRAPVPTTADTRRPRNRYAVVDLGIEVVFCEVSVGVVVAGFFATTTTTTTTPPPHRTRRPAIRRGG